MLLISTATKCGHLSAPLSPAQSLLYEISSEKTDAAVGKPHLMEHRGDGKRFVVRADEKLTAFVELESAVCARGKSD